tara:strand:+ start:280 stop:882 length:603 start_codon:yes stop_codon:yes gene_type:complete
MSMMTMEDIREPSWKKWVVPVPNYLTHQQCDQLCQMGRDLLPEESKIGHVVKGEGTNKKIRNSTIAFFPKDDKHKFLYNKLLQDVLHVNRDNFGFDKISLFENTQYTEYDGNGGHYTWHPDSEINGENNGIVRKISMSVLLNDRSEFDGGDLEILTEGRKVSLQKGDAVFFASFLLHRVEPLTRGTRKSLVQWFTGPSFK